MKISNKENLPEMLKNPGGENLQEILGRVAGDVTSHSLAEVHIQPGNKSSKHFHKHSEESYFILSGVASVEINNTHHQLMPGEAVLLEPLDVHQISNQGDQELVFVAVCVPAWSPDDSFDIEEA